MMSATTRAQLVKVIALTGAVLGCYLLLNQGVQTISQRLSAGDSWLGAVLHYLSFLTILTNAALVAVYAWFLSGQRVLRWMGHPSLHAFLVALALLVGAVWHVLLRPTEGLSVNGVGLHYVAPALFLIWWILRKPKERPRFFDGLSLMLIPIGYAVWVLSRGALTGDYPYDFITVPNVGYQAALTTIGALMVAQLLLAMGFVAVGRFRAPPA
ncbi:MAG: Pr6Pr family membrane protein [Pseudomonadota bacterium]